MSRLGWLTPSSCGQQGRNRRLSVAGPPQVCFEPSLTLLLRAIQEIDETTLDCWKGDAWSTIGIPENACVAQFSFAYQESSRASSFATAPAAVRTVARLIRQTCFHQRQRSTGCRARATSRHSSFPAHDTSRAFAKIAVPRCRLFKLT